MVKNLTTMRRSLQNNVSDILADSVQIKRKESELRQRELKLREEEQRKQNTCLPNRRKLNSNNTR